MSWYLGAIRKPRRAVSRGTKEVKQADIKPPPLPLSPLDKTRLRDPAYLKQRMLELVGLSVIPNVDINAGTTGEHLGQDSSPARMLAYNKSVQFADEWGKLVWLLVKAKPETSSEPPDGEMTELTMDLVTTGAGQYVVPHERAQRGTARTMGEMFLRNKRIHDRFLELVKERYDAAAAAEATKKSQQVAVKTVEGEGDGISKMEEMLHKLNPRKWEAMQKQKAAKAAQPVGAAKLPSGTPSSINYKPQQFWSAPAWKAYQDSPWYNQYNAPSYEGNMPGLIDGGGGLVTMNTPAPVPNVQMPEQPPSMFTPAPVQQFPPNLTGVFGMSGLIALNEANPPVSGATCPPWQIIPGRWVNGVVVSKRRECVDSCGRRMIQYADMRENIVRENIHEFGFGESCAVQKSLPVAVVGGSQPSVAYSNAALPGGTVKAAPDNIPDWARSCSPWVYRKGTMRRSCKPAKGRAQEQTFDMYSGVLNGLGVSRNYAGRPTAAQNKAHRESMKRQRFEQRHGMVSQLSTGPSAFTGPEVVAGGGLVELNSGAPAKVGANGDYFGIVAYTDPVTLASVDYCFATPCWGVEKNKTGGDLKNCIKGKALGTGSVQERCNMYDPNGPQSMFGMNGLGAVSVSAPNVSIMNEVQALFTQARDVYQHIVSNPASVPFQKELDAIKAKFSRWEPRIANPDFPAFPEAKSVALDIQAQLGKIGIVVNAKSPAAQIPGGVSTVFVIGAVAVVAALFFMGRK